MRNIISAGKEFFIISRCIDNASKCKVIDVFDDSFSVETDNDVRYENNEVVEMFTMTKQGQLYFETIVQSVNGNIVKLWFPITHKFLQRREFSRISSDKKVFLKKSNLNINANIIDISAGGLKIFSEIQPELQKEYEVELEIDKNNIKCVYEPIRLEAVEGGFISSGRFKAINNADRITIVQYCFRIQTENGSK